MLARKHLEHPTRITPGAMVQHVQRREFDATTAGRHSLEPERAQCLGIVRPVLANLDPQFEVATLTE